MYGEGAQLMRLLKRGEAGDLPAPEGTTKAAWKAVVWAHYLRWLEVCLRGGTADTKNACRKEYIHAGGGVDTFVLFCKEFPPLMEKPASKAKAIIEAGLDAMFNGTATPQDNNDGSAAFNSDVDGCEMTLAHFHDEIYNITPQEAWGI